MSKRREQMIRALGADGPHPSLGEQAQVFDRFVGTWNADYTNFAPDGAVLERSTGQVLFGWILDGRAVQDIWTWESGDASQAGSGTTIRYFDTAAGVWQVIWILPQSGLFLTLRGGMVGDRIVLEGENADGSRRRWSFNDIGPDAFTWRGERSEDAGSTWHPNAEYRMTRAAE